MIPEAGEKAVLFGAEGCNLAVEALDLLQMCGVVGGWTNTRDHGLGCDL
jgi:hypothetical protein